jgi:hypothetical protein
MFRRLLMTAVLTGALVAGSLTAALAVGPPASRGAGSPAGSAAEPQGCASSSTQQARRDAAIARRGTAPRSGAQPAGAAAPWSPTDLATLTDYNNSGGLAVTSLTKATVVSTSGDYLFASRTTDAGTTWTPWASIPDGSWKSFEASVANFGKHVDVLSSAWKGQNGDALHYIRSNNRGRTWQPAMKLGRFASGVRLVRGFDGTVAAAWWQSGKVKARVSTDGGVTFGATKTLGTYRAQGCAFETGLIGLGLANGTVIASYWVGTKSLQTRRTTDGGVTWTAPQTFTNLRQGYWNGMATMDTEVLAIYDAKGKLRTRVSHDSGATWSAPVIIANSAAFATTWVGDAWGVAYEGTDELDYVESTDGFSWSAPSVVDTRTGAQITPYQMGFVGGAPAVAYTWTGAGVSDPEILSYAIRQ